MPEFYLKRAILEKFPQGSLEQDVADSVDFTVHSVSFLLFVFCLAHTLLLKRPVTVGEHESKRGSIAAGAQLQHV